jgi:hypothetical protein
MIYTILALFIALLAAVIVNVRSFSTNRKYYKKLFGILAQDESILEKNRLLLMKVNEKLNVEDLRPLREKAIGFPSFKMQLWRKSIEAQKSIADYYTIKRTWYGAEESFQGLTEGFFKDMYLIQQKRPESKDYASLLPYYSSQRSEEDLIEKMAKEILHSQ